MSTKFQEPNSKISREKPRRQSLQTSPFGAIPARVVRRTPPARRSRQASLAVGNQGPVRLLTWTLVAITCALALLLTTGGCSDEPTPVCMRNNSEPTEQCPEGYAVQCPSSRPLSFCQFESEEADEGVVLCCADLDCLLNPIDTTDAVCKGTDE